MLSFRIGGELACTDSVTFYEPGFEKQSTTGGSPFQLTIGFQEFDRQFRPIYEACIRELVRDDAITGKFHPPYPGAVRYPSLEEFLQLPTVHRMEMADAYFIFDLLRIFFSEAAERAATQWAVSALTSVQFDGDEVMLKGEVVPL